MAGLSRRRVGVGILCSTLAAPGRRASAQGVPARGRPEAAAGSGPEIGRVERIVVWGYGTPPRRPTRDLFARMAVVENEVIETPRDGAVHIVFADGTSFRVGSRSTATLDRFVFDPSSGRGQMALDLGAGAFRIVSGRLDKRDYSIRTPVATMGLRGTDFVVDVAPDGTTVVSVLSGAVTIGGTVVAQGQLAVARAGEPVVAQQRPAFARGFTDPGLDDAPMGEGGAAAGGGHGSGGPRSN